MNPDHMDSDALSLKLWVANTQRRKMNIVVVTLACDADLAEEAEVH
jgi:hypothetical protein